MYLDTTIQERPSWSVEIPAKPPRERSGRTNPDQTRITKPSRRRWNEELRKETRFATLHFVLLPIDLNANPEIHGQCGRAFQLSNRATPQRLSVPPHGRIPAVMPEA